jgi:hypothetical protein
MGTFTNIFTGSPVQPADVSFGAYTIANGQLTLVWPVNFNNDTQSAFARIMNIEGVDEDDELLFPDATLVSVGMSCLIYNVGSEDILIKDNDGNELADMSAGQANYFYLEENTTAAGTWRTFTFGTGTSSADASQLSGFGLIAQSGKLNANFPIEVKNSAFDILASDRASLFIYTGGTAQANLPEPGSTNVSDGFWIAINNESQTAGLLTINNAYGFIDRLGQTSLQLATGSSTILISDGANNYYTLGLGLPTFFTIAVNYQDVSGSSDVTLSSEEAARQIQILTGTLTGNIDVIFPNVPYVWYVQNLTSGVFNLYIRTETSTPILIEQVERYIIVSDGTDMFIYPSISEAIVNSTYIVQQETPLLPNAQALENLATGMVKNTTGTGVLSIGVNGTDYYGPGTPNLLLSTTTAPAAPNSGFMYIYSENDYQISWRSFETNSTIYSNNVANTFGIGSQSYDFISNSAENNTVVGVGTGINITQGDYVTAIGSLSCFNYTTEDNVIAVGANTSLNHTGHVNCVFIGNNSGSSTNSTNVTIIGNDISTSESNVCIIGNKQSVGINTTAPNAALDIHTGNGLPASLILDDATGTNFIAPPSGTRLYVKRSGVAIGNYLSLQLPDESGDPQTLDIYTDSFSNLIGGFAQNLRNPLYSVFLGTRTYPDMASPNAVVAVGYEAGYNVDYAQNCVFIGYNSGKKVEDASNVIAIGAFAGDSYSDIGNCIFLGTGADAAVSGIQNSVAIGTNATVSQDNTFRLGGNGQAVVIGDTAPNNNTGTIEIESFNLMPAHGTSGMYLGRSDSTRDVPSTGAILWTANNDRLWSTGADGNRMINVFPIYYYAVESSFAGGVVTAGNNIDITLDVGASLASILRDGFDSYIMDAYPNAVLVIEYNFSIDPAGGPGTLFSGYCKFYKTVGVTTTVYDGVPADTTFNGESSIAFGFSFTNVRVTALLSDIIDSDSDVWGVRLHNTGFGTIQILGKITPVNAYIILGGIL